MYFSYWDARANLAERKKSRSQALVILQVVRFMVSTDLRSVYATTKMRSGVREGDDTLKRRVVPKFAEGDVSGAVRKLERRRLSTAIQRHA